MAKMARRVSLDSDGGSSNGDIESVISESFQHTMESVSNDPHHIAGYLLKKSQNDAWQKRYFETNSTYLTYYKTKKMSRLLAALNMATVGEITLVGHVNDSIGEGVIFQLELKDRNYVLRTSTVSEAEKWMYRLRKLRDEAIASSIPEEGSMDSSTRSTEPVVPKGSKGKSEHGEWSKAGLGGNASTTKPKSCCVVV